MGSGGSVEDGSSWVQSRLRAALILLTSSALIVSTGL